MKYRIGMLGFLAVILGGCLPWQSAATPTPPPTTVAEAPTAEASPMLAPPLEPTVTESMPTVAPTATAEPTATPAPPLSLEQREELFNDVWQTVDEHYLYPDFGGADWDAVYDEFHPQIATAPDNAAFYALLEQMVLRLNDEHSRFAAPVDARSEDALASGTDTYVGIGVLTNHEDSAAFVTMVFPDSPAEEGGLARGDRIIAVNGLPFTTTDAIRGPEGSNVQLTIKTPQQEPRDVVLQRRAVLGKIVPSSQRLPNAPSIGYLLIPSLWADDMHTHVITELRSLREAEPPLTGLIIDLRGNGGGWRSVLEGILEQFVDGNAGEFFSQSTSYPLAIKPGDEFRTYGSLPLVVLIDNFSASYAEVLAGALQQHGATVIGVPSQGNTETIFQYNFDDGSRLWVAEEGFRLNDGTDFEGHGVQPNFNVTDDWTQFSLPNDPAILAAIAALEKQGR